MANNLLIYLASSLEAAECTILYITYPSLKRRDKSTQQGVGQIHCFFKDET
jgi:hypothetical protein